MLVTDPVLYNVRYSVIQGLKRIKRGKSLRETSKCRLIFVWRTLNGPTEVRKSFILKSYLVSEILFAMGNL